MILEIEPARLKQAVNWLKGVGAEYIQVATRGGALKALAAVFVHGEVTLIPQCAEDVTVYLEVAALQRFTAKLSAGGNPVKLDVDGTTVKLLDGKTKATFQQPAAARNCQDVKPQGVKRVVLHPDAAALMAKYTARDGKFSFAKLTGGRAYAHDRIAAVSVPVTGDGFLARRVLEWGTDADTQYYVNPTGSFVREPATGSVLYESHANDLAAWPAQIPQVFANLENFPIRFSCDAAQLRRALQQYGKLDVEQAIRIEGVNDEGMVTIHGTKTVIEGELTTEADGAFEATLATATLMPFLNAAPDTIVRVRYSDDTPYLLAVDGLDARLLTPRGA